MTSSLLENLATGFYRDLSDEAYDAIPAARSTHLKVLASEDQTPAHLQTLLANPPKKKCFDLGNAAHYGILRPSEFDKKFVIAGQCEATKKGDGLRCENPGRFEANGSWFCGTKGHAPGGAEVSSRVVLTEEDYRKAAGMVEAVWAHKRVRKLLESAEIEVAGVWRDESTWELCKFRADAAAWNQRVIADIKTTQCASEGQFKRRVESLMYHVSAAFYLDGAAAIGRTVEQFWLIPVEVEPPHGVNLFLLDHLALRKGRELARAALEKLHHCKLTNMWPGFSDEPKTIGLTDWTMRGLTKEYEEGGF